MLKTVALSCGSLFFVILLIIVYNSKTKLFSIRSKLFRLLLLIVVLVLIFEIASGITTYYNNSIPVFNELLVRIAWLSKIVFLWCLTVYAICLTNKIEVDEFYELDDYAKIKFVSLLFSILGFLFFFIPFDYVALDGIIYISGPARYYAFFIGFVTLIYYLILFFINKKEVPTGQSLIVFLMLCECTIVFPIQLLFKDVCITTTGYSFFMFFLYFMFENPDLQLINDLQVTKKKIEMSNHAKSDFLSNMTHEIRSPMNAIIGFSDSLMHIDTLNKEDINKDLEYIYSSGQNLLDIINNILDISKIENEEESLNYKEYNPSLMFDDLGNIIKSRINDKPIKYITEIDNNLPSVLGGDSTKMYQILLNILTNAVKYTEVGHIKLEVHCDLKDSLVELHFKISDTGYGIKKEDFSKLFEKFSRLSDATDKDIEGTGLGLVITKHLVDFLNGKIWFESEYGVGTTFYINLVQKVINKLPSTEIKKEDKNVNNSIKYLDLSKYSALIVDDNSLNIKVAERLLSKYNFKIDSVTSGEKCIYNIKADKHYDIIFMDHMMPQMDGIETLHVLKKLDGYTIPVVIALTANAIAGMKEMYLKEGFDDYLSKPINIMELDKLINKYFNK